jgi:hypothetical protein
MLVLLLDIPKNKHMLKFIKPAIAVAIMTVTTLGVLSHDMHLDRATAVAVTLPVLAATSGAFEKVITPSYHTHVETVSIPRASSFHSSMPNMQPPRDDTRKYIQNKKLLYIGGSDATGFWPSI